MTIPQPMTSPWHSLPALAAARELHVEIGVGLTSEEAARRLGEYGPNRVAPAPPEPRRRAFLRQYRDPSQLILLAAGIGSLALGTVATAVVVLSVTLLNAILGLQREGKAAAAGAASPRRSAHVRRDGALRWLSATELVPGDVVRVKAGDVVPADGRLLDSLRLEVDESALTGQSLPAAKAIDLVVDGDAPLDERTDMVYMSTSVIRGAGEFVVTATGTSTEVGRISRLLQAAGEPEPPAADQLATPLLVIAAAALLASVAFGVSRGQAFETVFACAIALAVAAVPSGLPTAVTAILAHGARALAGANVIVHRLRSTERLGATSAINAGTTGTLTLDQMTAVELALPGRRFTVSGRGYASDGRIKHAAGEPELPLEELLLPLALASDAVVRDGGLIGDPTEGALVVLAEKGGLDVVATREKYPRVAELPFDAAYKLMATFHHVTDQTGDAVVRCFVKGGPDQLLARARSVLGPGLHAVRADEHVRLRYLEESARLQRRGLRVLATARRDFDRATFDPDADLLTLVDGLTLLALIGIVDPPRPQAKASIRMAKAAGVRVRMVTGDQPVTAAVLAGELGIDGRAVTGGELAALTDERLLEEIDGIGVIASAMPEHKLRLVETLRRKGHVVAMTGAGISDAPALKAADLGIAMGLAGSEAAKDAAALVATDNEFSTVVRAVEYGRGLSGNLAKSVRFQLAALAGMILTFLGAGLFHIAGGTPFLVLQTLFVNFTTQVSQAVGLGHGRPAAAPAERRHLPVDARRDARWLAVVALLHAVATLAVMAVAERAWGTDTARTMGLVTFSLANLCFSFTVRDELRSTFSLDTFADRAFVLCSAISVAAIVVGAQTRLFERILSTVSLDFGQWLLCLAAALTIVAAAEVRKALRRQARRPAWTTSA